MIYLDYAAATPLDEEVLKAMGPYLRTEFFNPSALYWPARRVRRDLDTARKTVATALGAKPTEIIFTAGATESINLAIKGILGKFPKKEIAISALEHEAVAASAKATGTKVIEIAVNNQGIIDLEKFRKSLNKSTVLVSVQYANGDIGTIQPLKNIAAIINETKQQRLREGDKLPLYFHTDATQAANYLPLQVNRLGVDLMTLNGSKIYGPKQTGCLYVKSGVELLPLINGGGQEKGLRSGTENVAGFIGFAAAIKKAQLIRKTENERLGNLQKNLFGFINGIKKARLNGRIENRLPSNINISFSGLNGEDLVHKLDARDILVATGAACSANKNTPSKALVAIGASDQARDGSLRLTMGRYTTKKDIDTLKEALKELLVS